MIDVDVEDRYPGHPAIRFLAVATSTPDVAYDSEMGIAGVIP
jgi:hypothetical protein